MPEPERSFNAGTYGYGFNGKRMEEAGPYITNIYDYDMRMYDARIGRFFSVDPLTGKYPELTPYVRTVLTDQQLVNKYPAATLEDSRVAGEKNYYDRWEKGS